jgi:hypothetical protein
VLPEITPYDCAQALDDAAEELLAEASVSGPPVDAFAVAAACRFSVALDDEQQGRARFVRLKRRAADRDAGAILIRSDPRAERLQWAVAHELGEALAEQVFRRLGVRPAETAADMREQVANALASHLLLPSRWFRAFGVRAEWDLLRLKRRFSTASHELIARRMLDFEPPAILTVFDHGRVTWRRTAARRPPRLSAAELQCWRRTHETAEPERIEQQGLVIRAWAVHEPEWKREILRTDLPTEDLDLSE